MPRPPPIPLPPPRPYYPYELALFDAPPTPVRVCALCEEHYARWQAYKRTHIYRQDGLRVPPAHLEQAAYLYMMFRAHVLQCRVVARSLGERMPYERCEAWNRWTRDVQQTRHFRAFRTAWEGQG